MPCMFLQNDVLMYVDGEFIPSTSKEWKEVINPVSYARFYSTTPLHEMKSISTKHIRYFFMACRCCSMVKGTLYMLLLLALNLRLGIYLIVAY